MKGSKKYNQRVWGHEDGAFASAYCAWLRLMGCAVRGRSIGHSREIPCVNKIDLDHWKGRSGKHAYRWLIPLCHDHHMQRHNTGVETWPTIYDWTRADLEAHIQDLWARGKHLVLGLDSPE